MPKDFQASEQCYLWKLQQKFDFTDRGLFIVSLVIDRHVCEDAPFWTNDRLEWISLVALLLSSIHGMMIGHYFLKLTKQLDKLQHLYDKRVE